MNSPVLVVVQTALRSAHCFFDGNYKAKPAYWAYVDASRLQPSIQDVVAAEEKR